MRPILAIVGALAVVAAVSYLTMPKATPVKNIPTPVYDAWVHWKQENGKSYGTNYEEEYRMQVFNDNFNFVRKYNMQNNSSTVVLNKFADLTREEFAAQRTGLLPKLRSSESNVKILDTSNLKTEVNWVTAGAVAPVKDQGHCGSCWAFSTIAAVESANYLQKHTSSVVTFSEQQLVDCAGGMYFNNGCHGGLMDNGFRYVRDHPVAKDSDYAYTARDGTCKQNSYNGVGTVSDFTDVRRGDADQLRAALNHQPVSVAIEADHSVFQLYKSGVLTGSACGTHLDHGVVAVGYGNENGEDYFLVRNSWGAGWGAEGYIKIGANNVCGILSQPSYPTA